MRIFLDKTKLNAVDLLGNVGVHLDETNCFVLLFQHHNNKRLTMEVMVDHDFTTYLRAIATNNGNVVEHMGIIMDTSNRYNIKGVLFGNEVVRLYLQTESDDVRYSPVGFFIEISRNHLFAFIDACIDLRTEALEQNLERIVGL